MSMKRQWNNDRNESRLQSFLAVIKYRGGVHGLSHAQRVERFGLMLAEKTDADRDVIIWFAYLHDSQRTNDGYDNIHGPEAARFVDTIRNAFLQELNDTQIGQLKEACRLHTSTHRIGDITIDTCFDADRLDLPRVGIMPDPKRMATEQGAMFAERGYDVNCDEARSNETTGLQFHDKIIKAGNGKSHFAVRYNAKTDDGKSIGPYTYSRGKLHYKEWNLSAKSVSESDCIRGFSTDVGTGIYAVELDTFLSGKGHAAAQMIKNQDVTLNLLEYTDDDVIARAETEICLRQCNIVFVSDQPTFMTKWKDGTINELMKQFITEKEAAEYNTYASPIRNIYTGLSMFVKDFKMNEKRLIFPCNHVSVLNVMENLTMPRTVINWGVAIKECKLDAMNLSKTFVYAAHNKYLKQLYDEEIEMLVSIFDKDENKDELMKARLKAFNDADIVNKYLFTGKNEYERLFYNTSKLLFDIIAVPLRKEVEEQTKSLMKLFQ